MQVAPDGTHATELYLEGVHCAACVWLVEKLPHVVPGVIEARLDLRRSLVRVRWDDDRVRLSRVARTLDSLGYPPHPAKDARARALRKQEDQRFLIRIGVAAACAGNVMTLAFALYGGMFTGIETQYSELFRWTSMLLGLVALAWPGNLFFRGAWAALRTRTAHLDLPIALGLAAGGVAGTVNAVLGRGEIYFDSLTMLVFLLLVGHWIQRRQQRWANDALELLFSLTPSGARRVEGDVVREVPLEALALGDLIEVRAGDLLPTDGTVVEGQSTVDQSLLTGESRPVGVAAEADVHAGTLNLGARLLVRVAAVGPTTRVGKLMQLVEECSRNRAPLVQFTDRVAGWFVIVVLLLATVTLGVWLWWDPAHAVDHAVAMLIVTCPCALGLATPLAVTVALGRAARRRILIKGGEVLERLARCGTMVLGQDGHADRRPAGGRLVEWGRSRPAAGCRTRIALGPSDRSSAGRGVREHPGGIVQRGTRAHRGYRNRGHGGASDHWRWDRRPGGGPGRGRRFAGVCACQGAVVPADLAARRAARSSRPARRPSSSPSRTGLLAWWAWTIRYARTWRRR